MCGLVGVLNFKKEATNDAPFLKWALESMHHRGPDSNGTWTNNQNYSAAFVRLAIRDLSQHGSQPMLSNCGNYVLSFNGEIYNTEPFKERLIKEEQINFTSTSDTEVLLYALIHWGAAYVLKHFDGIFAFAFYDNKLNRLVLARDRAGVKPLYIGMGQEGIVYSSQYDHIINHRFCRNNYIHTGALGAYLCLGYVPENLGILSGTYLLPHGHFVTIENNELTTSEYYSYPLKTKANTNSTLPETLQNTVEAQLVSDVAIGTFMSGGVDSPLVSYYANKLAPIHSFTIGVNDTRINESEAAQSFADIFKTQHHCKTISEEDLLESIADNTKAFSEPFADFSSIPTLVLSQYARQHVTVALSGDGGDELFWGYPRNSKMLKQGLQYQKNKVQRFAGFVRQKFTRTSPRTIIKKHLEEYDFPAFYYRSLFITGADHWLPKLFMHKPERAWWMDQLYKHPGALQTDAQSLMNVVRKLEFDIHLQRILLKVDRASMYHSLEVRVPLLSNAVIDYSTQLPYTECIKDGIGKINLKELLIEYSSRQLVMQPKKGFIIPLGEWIKGTLKNDIEERLLKMPADLAIHFNRQEIKNLLTEHFTGVQDWSWFIWALYSLVNWSNYHRNKFKD